MIDWEKGIYCSLLSMGWPLAYYNFGQEHYEIYGNKLQFKKTSNHLKFILFFD